MELNSTPNPNRKTTQENLYSFGDFALKRERERVYSKDVVLIWSHIISLLGDMTCFTSILT
jgi:hypothetical protein